MPASDNSPEQTRLLPLYGTMRLPSLTSRVLKDHAALGANTVLVCVTEEDFLYYRENVTKVILLCLMRGFRVYASAWGYGGLVGGEALSASDLYFKLVGEKRYLNSVHRLGPDAELTASQQAITDSPVFQLKRLQDVVAAAGADTFFYDEIKIQRPGRNDPGHIELETFFELARHAHNLGLRNSLCVSVINDDDLALLEQLVRYKYVDEVSFTRYYSPGHYGIDPEAYLGNGIEQVKAAVAKADHPVSMMGWVQGFDLQGAEDLVVRGAKAWSDHGVHSLGIWGGFCVNETPMLTPAGHTYLYKEIAQVFGGRDNAPKQPRFS